MTLSRKQKWSDQAACKTEDAQLLSLFYSSKKLDIARAKKICLACPVRIPCYDYAVKNKEPAGIWGGVVFDPVGPIIEKVVVPVSATYTYIPTRLHQPLSFQGQTSEISRSASVDQEPASKSNQAAQALIRISTQTHAD